MPIPVSQRFLDALASSEQTRVVQAQVWNGSHAEADLGTVVAGAVNVDVTAQIRRTCSLQVISQGLEYDDLIPTNINSLLHPGSGNELRLFRGFDFNPASPGSDVEVCPLGVFRMTRPRVTDTGDAITIDITGNDRSALCSARKWRDVHPISFGTNLRQAVHDALMDRLNDLGLTYKLQPTYGQSTPAVTFGTDLSGSNDPFADTMSLATAAGMELFFDPYGDPVMQPIPDPSLIPESFGSPDLYQEGVNCTMVEAERQLDETVGYNGVIVIGVGTGGPPVRAEVWDEDVTSPTYVGGPWGYQPFIYQTALIPASSGVTGIEAYMQALKVAQHLYRQVRTMLDVPAFQCIPNPALLESDGIRLVRSRIGLNDEYTSAQMSIPLDTTSPQTVTCRPKNIPLGAHPQPGFVLGTHGG